MVLCLSFLSQLSRIDLMILSRTHSRTKNLICSCLAALLDSAMIMLERLSPGIETTGCQQSNCLESFQNEDNQQKFDVHDFLLQHYSLEVQKVMEMAMMAIDGGPTRIKCQMLGQIGRAHV